MKITMPARKPRPESNCSPMTPVELKRLRAAKGWEQTDAAIRLCVPVATYRNWEQGRRAIPIPVARLVRIIFQ